MAETYKNLPSQTAQRDFRLKWAADSRAPLVQKLAKEKRTTWSRKDTQKFRYRPFGALVQDWGGWQSEEAVKGATNASAMCVAMGPPWVLIHPQSKLAEFAVVELSWQEEFEEAWKETMHDVIAEGAAEPAGSA